MMKFSPECLKLRRRFFFLAAVIFLHLFLVFQQAQAFEECINLFRINDEAGYSTIPQAKNHQSESKAKKVLNRLRTILFGVRPDIRMEDFEIWIAQNPAEPAFYDRADLARHAKNKLSEIIMKMKESGFIPRQPLKIVIQNSENAVTVKEATQSGIIKAEWRKYQGSAVVVSLGDSPVGLLQSSGKVYPISSKNSKNDLAVIFTKPNEFFHFFESDFVIIHELAHTTEKPQSRINFYWQEARADFLAFAFSGVFQIFISGGIRALSFHPDEGVVIREKELIRSMIEPSVPNTESIAPSHDMVHHNSQVISAALFDMSQIIGVPRVLEFIRKIDAATIQTRVPPLELTKTADARLGIFDATKAVIIYEIQRSGEILNLAISQSDLPAETKAQLKQILKDRGLLPKFPTYLNRYETQ